jgi:hypothetical protein
MDTAFLFSLLFFTSVGVPQQHESTELRAKLDARVSEYSLSSSGLADALIKLSKKFEIPIGIEWVRDEEASRGLTRTWRDETIRDIVRSIVKEYPGYDLQLEDGVVHVFRQDLLNDSRNFLNLKVPDFFDVHQEPAGFANIQLRTVIQNIVSPRHASPDAGEGGSYTSGSVDERPFTLTLRGLTVRQALESLAAVSEHNIWVVTFSDTSELTPTGFRRTETLWHPAPFPNIQQPMWDFLAWKEYFPKSTGAVGHGGR